MLTKIKDKKALLVEIALATNKSKGTIRIHWLGNGNIPPKYEQIVRKLIERRLKMQEISKRVEEKFLKENPINL